MFCAESPLTQKVFQTGWRVFRVLGETNPRHNSQRFDGSRLEGAELHQVLFICDRPAPMSFDMVDLLPCDGQYEWSELAWSQARPDEVAASRAGLVVGISPSRWTDAFDLFSGLVERSANKLSLAILPQEMDGLELAHTCKLLDDFVMWPATREEIVQRIRRLSGGAAQSHHLIREKLVHEIGFAQLVGEDPAFLRILERVPQVAQTTAPVLILGETGTGKEFTARAIHYLGNHRSHAFVPVDCGAIPDHVFENEMFGHVRGGYTDAHSDQKGLAEIADGGTLFLDEVDSLSPVAQSKLLRFLQERTFKPLGASKFVSVDVRIIAASNQDLEECVRKGKFRADLYYRLNVLKLTLPALRHRPLDIPLLANHFLKSTGMAADGARRWFSQAATRQLSSYSWPGNVRELHNVVQQAAFSSEGSQIRPSHLPFSGPADVTPAPAHFRAAKENAIAEFERTYVEQLLRETGGNVTQAARHAQQDRRSLGRLIKKYKLR
jgi:DNA-binding NtrC family response regulator